jgi:hypothetical protein
MHEQQRLIFLMMAVSGLSQRFLEDRNYRQAIMQRRGCILE